MTVEIVECLGCVLSGYLLEDDRSTGMSINEVRDIVYFVVDYKPQVVFCCVLVRC